MIKTKYLIKIIAGLALSLILLQLRVFAMESSVYRVSPDVLNESGGYSSSSSYRIWHNLGESPTGTSESATYRIGAGFLQPDDQVLSMIISSNSLDFGVLSSSLVSTQSFTVTISTDYSNGYTLNAYDNTPSGITNGLINGAKKISDATTPNNYINLPIAGVEHYGIVVTGTHAATGYASGTKINSLDDSTWIDIGSYDNYANNDVYNVEFRASISDTSHASINYQAVTNFIVTANF
jgi:hypothetical protein